MLGLTRRKFDNQTSNLVKPSIKEVIHMDLSFVKTVLGIVFYAVAIVSKIFVTAKELTEPSDKDK